MNEKITKVLGGCTVAGLVLSTAISTTNVQAAEVNVGRLEGTDRYETAANVAKLNWTAGETDNVILVSGQGYADALSASLLAQKLNAPILLTEKDKLNKNAYEAINKLGAKNVYILGLQGVISDDIENSLEKQGKKVTRLGGRNRYETNIAIANELITNHQVKADEVLVVNGNKYLADALTAAPVAAKEGKILLLVGEDETSAKEAKNFINNYKAKATVIGGKVTVPDTIYNKLGAAKRINGGKDRFETNRLILDAFNVKGTYVCVANGQTDHLVDSLVASALAGKYKSPMVLVSNNEETDIKVIDYMKDKLKINNESKVAVLGGKNILPEKFIEKIGKVIISTKLENSSDKEKKSDEAEISSDKFLDVVKEDGKTAIDEDNKTPGIQISLKNKESLKIKVVEKDNKKIAVKVINNESIDLGKDSAVNKVVAGETITLTAVKEGKSIITIKHGSQKINLEVTVKKSNLEPSEAGNGENVNPAPAPVNPELAPVEPVPGQVNPAPGPALEHINPAPAQVNPEPAPVEPAPAPVIPEPVNPVPAPNKVGQVVQNNGENLVKNSKVELISQIERHGVRGVLGNEQQSHITIDVFGNDGILQNDQDIIIAGRTVRVNKGDNSYKIKCKIIKAFENDKDWIAENIFIGVQGNRPVRVTLTRKSFEKNEDKLGIDNSEIRFLQVDSMYGRVGIEEVKEICNITVTGVSNKQETINVNVAAEKNRVLNQTVSINVKPTDTTKDVAKAIYNAFQANEVLKAIYRIELNEQNSKIILTQKLGDLIDTIVTIK